VVGLEAGSMRIIKSACAVNALGGGSSARTVYREIGAKRKIEPRKREGQVTGRGGDKFGSSQR